MKSKWLNFFLFFGILTLFIACERSTEKRKIRLSSENTVTKTDERLSTTIHLEPTLRRAVAVMFFDNQTGDQNFEWLQKGLTEMFIRSLSQSQYLSVLSTERLYEILERLGKTGSTEEVDMDMAAIVAKEANVEAILSGNITKRGDSLRIDIKVHEPNRSQTMREESIEGRGLENIFSMVDHLTQRIKSDFKVTPEKDEPSRGIADLSTNSLEAWRHYSSGVDFSNKLLYADAVTEFQKAVELDSTFVSAYLELCGMLMNQQEINRGLEVLNTLKSIRGKATQQEKYEIDLYEALNNRDIKSAISVYEQWIEQFPEDRDANMSLANLYLALRNYDQAIHYYQKVLTIDPKYKLTYNQLGYIYAYRGDYADAISILEKYRETAPDEPNPYDSQGEIYLFMGDYKNAEKRYKKSLEVNDNFIASLIGLGNIYLDTGQYRKALNIFKQHLAKAADRGAKTTAYSQLALTHWKLGETEKAVANYEKLLDLSTNSYIATERMNEIYLKSGDSTRAFESLKKNYIVIRNSITGDPTLITSLAILSLEHEFNTDETIDVLQQVFKASDNRLLRTQANFFLTLLYMKTNRLDDLERLSEVFTDEFLTIFKENRNMGYINIWKYYSTLNEFYHRHFDQGTRNYRQLIDLCAEHNLNMPEMVFRIFLTDLYLHAGKNDEARQLLQTVGMPKEEEWMVIGPFDNKDGFRKQYPPEKKIDLEKMVRDRSQSVVWQHAKDEINDGYVNLRQIHKQSNWSVAYGLIYIHSPNERNVQFRLGTDESVKLWLNNALVWRFNRYRGAIFDDDIFQATLKPGLNKILIKVCNRLGEWGFYFRVTDEQGNGINDIQFIPADKRDDIKP
ncbi:MAG: tetratricopeptide repeat protein [bacterium]